MEFNDNIITILDDVIKDAKESIIMTDAQLDLPGPKIIYVNDSACELFGYTREDLIGETPRIFQGEKTDQEALQNLRQALDAGKCCVRSRAINYKKDGTEFWLDWEIHSIKQNEETVCFYAIQRDVTELVELLDVVSALEFARP